MEKCDCVSKMKEELKAKRMLSVAFANERGTLILLPFTYHTVNEKTGELTTRVYHGNFIPKYCPFCGKQLRED